jgi:hypothetical protein
MRVALIVLLLPLALAGCISFSSSSPSPPARDTTIVVPPIFEVLSITEKHPDRQSARRHDMRRCGEAFHRGLQQAG